MSETLLQWSYIYIYMHHPRHRTAHTTVYGALDGMRNSSSMKDRSHNPPHHEQRRSTPAILYKKRKKSFLLDAQRSNILRPTHTHTHTRAHYLVLELGGVAPADGHHGAVDVELADDGAAVPQLRAERGAPALAQPQQPDEDVLLWVLVRQERLPAPVGSVVTANQFDLRRQRNTARVDGDIFDDISVTEHWLEREIAEWVHHMRDRSKDPSHHEQTLIPQSYISLRIILILLKLVPSAKLVNGVRNEKYGITVSMFTRSGQVRSWQVRSGQSV